MARACLTIFLAFFSIHLFADEEEDIDSLPLRNSITVSGLRSHQRALQDIADQHGGRRMATTEGYRASVAYVASQLRRAGYQITLQDFPITISQDRSTPMLLKTQPTEEAFVDGIDFQSMSTTGFSELSAEVEAVDLTIPSLHANHSTSGCEIADFQDFTRGNIALLQRGGCTFRQKIDNAIAAGAVGAIIFNEGNEGRTECISSRITSSKPDFPVLGAHFLVGDALRGNKLSGPTDISVLMRLDVSEQQHIVQNVIAERDAVNNDRVVVVGAHLDSVRAGPGMNDNGSGSATILEIALKLVELGQNTENKIRFIWFGAEEFGLLGSEYYVRALSERERSKIIAMLNFDMLGSSNYVRFVYDGDSAHGGSEASGYIENIFLKYFLEQGMRTHPTAFDGRSDYGPFIEVGIPAGGLFSGAEGLKTREQQAIYGGTAGQPYDPCYHRACDDFSHTGETSSSAGALLSLDQLSDAAAHAVLSLGSTRELDRSEVTGPRDDIPFEYRGNYLIR